MKRPTYCATECMRITVVDEDARRCSDEDRPNRIVCRLLDWMMESGIYPIEGTSGGSAWFKYGDYLPGDADRIKGWLNAELRKLDGKGE